MHQVKVEMDQGQQEVINVDELDITSVKTGQTAKITLEAIFKIKEWNNKQA